MNTSLLPLIGSTTGPRVMRRRDEVASVCPFCHSSEVRKLSGMAASATPLSGNEAADRSQRGYFMGIFKDSTSMGVAAQSRRMVPPPVPRGTRTFLLALMAVGLFVVGLSFFGKVEVGFGIFAGVMTVVAALSFVQCNIDERTFSARMKRWDNSWCCLRCGRSFTR